MCEVIVQCKKVDWWVKFLNKHWGRVQRYKHWCVEWGKHLCAICCCVEQTKGEGEEGKDGAAIIDIGYKHWELCNTKEVEEGKKGEDKDWKTK